MNNTEKSKRIKGILFLLVIILFFGVIGFLVGKPLVTMASNPEAFRDWIDQYGIWGRVAFIGLVVVQNVIAVIPGEPLEICAGYAFGAVEGAILCIVGSVIGGLIVFLFVRKFGMRFVELFFDREKLENLKFFKNTRRLNLLVFIFMLIPGTPKDLMSYFVGLTKMKLPIWMLINAIGRLPSIITSTIGGQGLGSKQYLMALIIFVVTIALSAVGMLIYRRFVNQADESEDKE